MKGSLKLEAVGVDRGTVRVVLGVSYEHHGAGWIGIVGANGSGKTSLLRAAAGRLPLAAGRIFLDGRDVSGDRAARARAIGFAPDANMLPGDLSPAELFSLGTFGATQDVVVQEIQAVNR